MGLRLVFVHHWPSSRFSKKPFFKGFRWGISEQGIWCSPMPSVGTCVAMNHSMLTCVHTLTTHTSQNNSNTSVLSHSFCSPRITYGIGGHLAWLRVSYMSALKTFRDCSLCRMRLGQGRQGSTDKLPIAVWLEQNVWERKRKRER